jgi:hypothetical protein
MSNLSSERCLIIRLGRNLEWSVTIQENVRKVEIYLLDCLIMYSNDKNYFPAIDLKRLDGKVSHSSPLTPPASPLHKAT